MDAVRQYYLWYVAGLTGKNDITPYTIAEYSSDHGYYQSEWGTSWSLMTEGIRNFGVVGTNIELSKENVFSELEKGHPIVCSMRPRRFHYHWPFHFTNWY